ncbi:hypothetical protein LOD99_13826 [Oopsacas minuta]|uniref:Uncharacterized protein n=1 Tax=Oopsacas minuta TaxID=111878 RepID=A0AAV7KLA3_9METZ|nr:hypothetical protein LOD99_13826 [Oopsacas minuta]
MWPYTELSYPGSDHKVCDPKGRSALTDQGMPISDVASPPAPDTSQMALPDKQGLPSPPGDPMAGSTPDQMATTPVGHQVKVLVHCRHYRLRHYLN